MLTVGWCFRTHHLKWYRDNNLAKGFGPTMYVLMEVIYRRCAPANHFFMVICPRLPCRIRVPGFTYPF